MFASIIAALDKNRLIGKRGGLPWYLPADLKHFKEITWGKPIIMGRTTHESIGRPLPGRTNIVLTEKKEEISGCVVAHSVEGALMAAKDTGSNEVIIIGGARVYEEFLPTAKRMYLTLIDHAFEGDVYFPLYNEQEWREEAREPHEPDEKNRYAYTFVTEERI